MESCKPINYAKSTKLDTAWDTEMGKERLLSLQGRTEEPGVRMRCQTQDNWHYTGAQNIIVQ